MTATLTAPPRAARAFARSTPALIRVAVLDDHAAVRAGVRRRSSGRRPTWSPSAPRPARRSSTGCCSARIPPSWSSTSTTRAFTASRSACNSSAARRCPASCSTAAAAESSSPSRRPSPESTPSSPSPTRGRRCWRRSARRPGADVAVPRSGVAIARTRRCAAGPRGSRDPRHAARGPLVGGHRSDAAAARRGRGRPRRRDRHPAHVLARIGRVAGRMRVTRHAPVHRLRPQGLAPGALRLPRRLPRLQRRALGLRRRSPHGARARPLDRRPRAARWASPSSAPSNGAFDAAVPAELSARSISPRSSWCCPARWSGSIAVHLTTQACAIRSLRPG